MHPLCRIETPFAEKFGVPRQPLLVEEAQGVMRFPKNDFFVEAFRGIEAHSHLWLIFEFDLVREEDVQALVRPPRFEGKHKLGVFATRSPHRPNRLGLSVVKFDRLEITDREVKLFVSGVDLVSGTPILDIKPYVPYVDAITEAKSLFSERPTFRKVEWDCDFQGEEKKLIEKIISLDPRPGHQKDLTDEYGVSIAGYNVIFQSIEDKLVILKISKE
jgi:tRNA-Thr(GGU) m(6)t(6)A37 methyltransferase TsaA